MSFNSQEPDYLRIGKPASTCCACGIDLSARSRHPSVIPGESSGLPITEAKRAGGKPGEKPEVPEYRRQDYCDNCWGQLRSEGYFSFWMARREPRDPMARQASRLRKVRLWELFQQLWAESQSLLTETTIVPEERLFRISVLAHVLMHLRVFKWEGDEVTPDGKRWVRFTHITLNQGFRVTELNLASPDVEDFKAELDRFLGIEGTASPSPGAETKS